MEIKEALTRALLNWLPADEQERMAAVVAWLCADLSPTERREKMEKLAPRLPEKPAPGKLDSRWLVCRWY